MIFLYARMTLRCFLNEVPQTLAENGGDVPAGGLRSKVRGPEIFGNQAWKQNRVKS